MKKIICIVTGAMLAAALMVGCGTNAANVQSNQTSQSTSNNNKSNKQKNFQNADLSGEVSSIDGNKITLKVIKTPERAQGDNEKNENKQNKQAKGQGKKQVEYTGETKDITIGDGVQIKEMGRGQQGSDSKNLTVSDIKVGDMLMVTYSDKESETISNIVIRPAANQNDNTSNN
jgi:hypothetical protein